MPTGVHGVGSTSFLHPGLKYEHYNTIIEMFARQERMTKQCNKLNYDANPSEKSVRPCTCKCSSHINDNWEGE